jgi:hypothetical protein
MPLQDQIAAEWNACIAAAGVAHPITFAGTDVSVTANTVTTAGTFRPDLPDLGQFFFGDFFPQNSGPEYHHFTPPESFRGIIASGKIRLSAVLKRFSEEEFRPFYDDHEIDGYKKRLEAGVPMEQRFVRDTFFWSLTSPNLDAREEQNMWDCFAGQDGVRLVFSITDVHTELRRVYYPTGTKNIPLLKQMMGVACRSDKFLVFNGLSKMGFFYLPRMFKPENETRLLIKRDRAKDLGLPVRFHPDGYDYLDLPFNNPLAKITLREVRLGPSADEKAIRPVLAATPGYAAVGLALCRTLTTDWETRSLPCFT